MDVEDLIEAVLRGESQPAEELQSFAANVANGTISTQAATRWLKAVHKHGMTTADTVILTKAMIDSGARLTWPAGPPVVDKHSTG